ncbi:hypothetical protein OROHE_026299 [Orobanche hederae]
MRDGNSKKSKLLWPKTLVKKWFNIKSKAGDFQADEDSAFTASFLFHVLMKNGGTTALGEGGMHHQEKQNRDQVREALIESAGVKLILMLLKSLIRTTIATWNVDGNSPSSYLNLEDWLHTSPPADIYVLGFHEIVPLNAGNILGTEDNEPANKWHALIRKMLNTLPDKSFGCRTPSPIADPIVELDSDFEGSTAHQTSSLFHRWSFQSLSRSMRVDADMMISQPRLDRRSSVCDRVIYGHRLSDYDPNYK